MYLQLLTTQGESTVNQPPIQISKQNFSMGTSLNCDFQLPDTGAISSIHAVISDNNGQLIITDQGEFTPVWLNGKALGFGESSELHAGDMLRISTQLIKMCELEVGLTPMPTQHIPYDFLPFTDHYSIPLSTTARVATHSNLPRAQKTSELDQLFSLNSTVNTMSSPSYLDPLHALSQAEQVSPIHFAQSRNTHHGYITADDAIDALFGIKK
ncbi:FHA domain-containing protein [Chitinibacter sp. GC72]|uniref:FHA domain-containing protein n=1 Tax=Chitinibacter sp. GC72 TaxID=1526917 RepID=UPI0012FC55F0|nr:FHA domain-containing protein [Chitinibacter sp. GC72]